MKFNTTSKGTNTTTNYEGEKAYKLSHELELYSLVVTSSLSKKFYESTDNSIERLRNLIRRTSHEFISKLAIYTREEMYLRSIPLVLIVELAKAGAPKTLLKKVTSRVIKRADELTEILAYYQIANNRTGTKKLNKLSNGIKEGLAEAFNKFDEYQIAKYNRKANITLKDVLFLTHPKAKNNEQQEIYNKLVKNGLSIPYTWETELSKGEDKKTSWEKLIASKKLGYMATLRNLRNILDSCVGKEYIIDVCNYISSEKAVLNSKQLPFRFLSAHKELRDNNNPLTCTVLNSLEDAILHSTHNIKGYDYNTTLLIASDVSGSMIHPISPKSTIQYYDIGLTLSMLLQSKCKSVITGIFGDIFKIVQLPQKAILSNVEKLYSQNGCVGYSTNGHLILNYLNTNNIKVDKIMIFTDLQMWNSYGAGANIRKEWRTYKQAYPGSKLYLFDLSGYGNTPLSVNNNDVHFIAGWSDKIFDILDSLDNGGKSLDLIKKIVI